MTDGSTLTYPRFRQDVAFLETAEGVLVRAPDQSFVIRGRSAYRLLSVLLPHLDGTTALTEVLEGVPQPRAEMVTALLRTLQGRGVVIEGFGSAPSGSPVGAQFASQRLLVNDLGDDGTGFERVLNSRVAVVGTDPGLAGILVEALTANGVGAARSGGGVRLWSTTDAPTDGSLDADLVVLVELGAPPARLLDLLRAAALGSDVLGVLRLEDQIVIGPWQTRGGQPAIESALLRMAENGVPGVAALLQAAVWGSGACPARPRLPGLAPEIALSSAAFEIFRSLAAVPGTDLRSGLLRLDTGTLRMTHEPTVLHPAVVPAGRLSRTTGPLPPVDLAVGSATTAVPRVSVDADTEYYTRFAPLVGELAGVLRRFDDDAAPQLPVKVGVLDAPATGASPVVDFAASTVLDARLAALERAAGRYAVELHRRLDLLPVARDGERVEIEDLASWTGADGSIRWTVAQDRHSRRLVRVPIEAVLSGPWDRAAAVFEPSLAGLGVAPTLAAAAYRSLLDAVGDDTRRRVEEGRTVLDEVELPDLGRSSGGAWGQVKLLTRSAVADGWGLRLFQGQAAAPFAVVLSSDGTATWAAASSWVEALERALLALLGAGQLRRWAPTSSFDLADRTIDLADATHSRTDRTPGDLARAVDEADVLERLHQQGRKAWAVTLTTPDLRGVTEVVRTLLARAS